MIKKTLTYHDFEGIEYTKDFYFSMNQTEFGLLNNRIPGGLENYLKTIQDNKDSARLLDLITMFITESYGERSADGTLFFKKDPYGRKLGESFIGTEACDNLISDLLADGNESGILSFLVGILPTNVRGKVETELKKAQMDANIRNQNSVQAEASVPAEVTVK